MLGLVLATPGPLRILAVGAHPDDVEIGAGATLAQLCRTRPGTSVRVEVMTATPERAAETRAALADLCAGADLEVNVHLFRDTRLPDSRDAIKDLFAEVSRIPFDLVIAPQPRDAHQDHRLLGEVVPTAFRDHLVLHYEIPKWDGDLGTLRANVYVALSAAEAEAKWELLDRHFASQRPHDWWSRDTFVGLARLRGIECRAPYAEAFHLAKAVLCADAEAADDSAAGS